MVKPLQLAPTGTTDDWGHPTYLDVRGRKFADLNFGEGEVPDIHRLTPDWEEPDYRVKAFEIVDKHPEEPDE